MAMLLQLVPMCNARPLENEFENRKSFRWAGHYDPAEWANPGGAPGGIKGADQGYGSKDRAGSGGSELGGCRCGRLPRNVSGARHQSGPLFALHKRLDYQRTRQRQMTIEEKNKALVLEAFVTLFNQRDYAAAERFWSPDYIQHSAHIAPGRDGLFNLIKSMPPTLKYEPGAIVAEGDMVIVHGRFGGFGAPANWIAADIVRIQNGVLVEHWDVIEDEATEEQSASKRPMFGTTFPTYA